MLDPDTALATLAQLGVAIPGFAAVIGALRQRDVAISPAERTGFFVMLTLASIVVIGSLAPFVLAPVLGEEQMWRACTLGLGIALVVFGLAIARVAIRGRGTDAAPRRPLFLWLVGIVPVTLVGGLLCLGSSRSNSGIYLGGLVLSVVWAGIQFWFSILSIRSVTPTA